MPTKKITTAQENALLKEHLAQISKRLRKHYDKYDDPSLVNLKQRLELENMNRSELDALLHARGCSTTEHWIPHISASHEAIQDLLVNSKQGLAEKPTKTSTIKQKRNKLLLKHQNNKQHPILLTLPSKASTDIEFLEDVIGAGVTAVRINTAHDDITTRKMMAKHVKQVAKKLKKHVQVYVDLASRKMRTSHNKRVMQPVQLAGKKERKIIIFSSDPQSYTCIAESSKAIDYLPTVAVTQHFIDLAATGGTIQVTDMRGKVRTLEIIDTTGHTCLCVLKGKTIIDKYSTFTISTETQTLSVHPLRIRPQPETITVKQGDTVVISGSAVESTAAYIEKGKEYPVILSITDPELLVDASIGDTIMIDDGKIRLEISSKKGDQVVCLVTRTLKETVTIKEEKGINFPDTNLSFPALSDEDKRILPEILAFADIVGISFAQSGEDILEIKQLLKTHSDKQHGIVAKIETKQGINNLPHILEELIDYQVAGIMIARGDLAVEVGFPYLAHHQQYISRLCQAAHIPVIYATSVCENGMKKGQPTRSEIIDLMHGLQADCLMLNKGPYVVDVIEMIHELSRIHRN